MASLREPRAAAQRPEYHVVLLDRLQPTRDEWRRAAIGTAAVHVLVILALIAIPRQFTPPDDQRERSRYVTHLVDPPTRLTQKAPNRAPVSPSISVATPAVVAPPRRFQAPPAPPPSRAKAAPVAPSAPPKVTAAQSAPALPTAPPLAAQPPRVDPPKLVLEAPPPAPSGPPTGKLKVPGAGVEDAIREIARGEVTPSRSVGDNIDQPVEPRVVPGMTVPTPTRPKLNLEMVSDPNGVDMKPYLLQVLQLVRRNWLSIYPESARIGAKGLVVVQFAIAPNGKIIKTVYMSHARLEALDRAAIAALSMSDPLPELPPDYKGSRVVLQFSFAYNAGR